MSNKLTHEQRLKRSHVQLMRAPEFARLSGVIMLGESKVVDDMPTAATNGRDKYYGRAFMDTLQDERELNFVVAHENFHVLLQHLTTWQKLYEKNPMVANMACDYVINLMILDLDPKNTVVKVPDMQICLDEKYRGWSSVDVFKDLMQNDDSDCGGGSSGNGKGAPLDNHMWGEAKDMSAQEKEDLSKAVEQAIRQGDILAGKLGGKSSRELGLLPEPKVNWREQLRDFVTNVTAGRDASTWRRPNRRWLAQDMYMPSPYAESIGPVVIGIDTSASISQDDIAEFLSEVQSIADTMPPERMHLLYWDTRIAREETYAAGEYAALTTSTKPAGGGGTDPRCVQTYVQNMGTKPEFVLMLSDGYVSDWPTFSMPSMWAMTSSQTAPNAVNIKLR
jgi:predicted metal-dependent peptidase